MASEEQDQGASADADRAVVNGAGQAVSALRASVPSAVTFALTLAALSGAYHWGYHAGYRDGGAQMRDAILCVGLATTGDVNVGNRHYCNKLGVDFSRLQAQAIEARRAETGTGSVHESAAAESDAP